MSSLLRTQLLKLIKRPTYIMMNLRGRSLFLLTWLLSRFGLLNSKLVKLHSNVRLQKLSSVMAESPHAKIEIGENSIIYEDAKIAAYGNGQISIGHNSVVGEAKIISKNSITIGSHFITSWNVYIQDYDSHPTNPDLRRHQLDYIASSFQPKFETNLRQTNSEHSYKMLDGWNTPSLPIIIGDNVWVGANSSILKGAHIGANSIVAAHSVVLAGTYPDNSILVGVPAKAIPISS